MHCLEHRTEIHDLTRLVQKIGLVCQRNFGVVVEEKTCPVALYASCWAATKKHAYLSVNQKGWNKLLGRGKALGMDKADVALLEHAIGQTKSWEKNCCCT